MSWLSKATGIHLGSDVKKVGDKISEGISGGGRAVAKLAKGSADFSVNLATLGLVDPKWSGTETFGQAGKYGGYAMAAVAGGYGVSTMFAPVTAAPLTGLELEAASGTGMGLWAEPVFAASDIGITAVPSSIATGLELEAAAGSAVAWSEPGITSGIFSSIGSGLKSVASSLGLIGLSKSIMGGAVEAGESQISSYIERETSSMFGGSGSGTATESDSGGTGILGGMVSGSTLPYILIALTLLGAFILTRKRRKK